ncbi:O-antigen ligase family protein [Stieleria sp. TO1_6]|uniref:O-antigen ligase family protein n=1 Tax=Stieleria tagensis TaxID=2956795 RepID=UPI00209AE252|nr:O-antigen ligase family protein [Stieleria tagensis]MCO8123448.1 O-antigen ligase family protein [Stieleria tagensis]
MVWMILFGLVIAGTALVSLRRPGVAIGLMMVMFGLEQFLQAKSATFVERGNLVNVGVAFVALVATCRMLLSNLGLLKWTHLQTLVILLFGYAFLSSLWTVAPREFEEYFQSQWPYFALYFGLGPILCSESQSIQDAVKSTLVLGIPIMIALAFFCEWTGRGIKLSTPVMDGGKLRHYTPPLAAASCAAVIAILTLSTLSKQWGRRLVGLAVLLLCTYIIIRTQSRGQLVAFCFVSALVYPATHRSVSNRAFLELIVIIVILVAAVFAAFVYAGETAGSRWQQNSMDHAMEGRALMVQRLFLTWTKADPLNWIFGLGASSSFRISSFYVHNVPVEILCELGLVGAVLFGMFCWRSFSNAVFFVAQIPSNWEYRSCVIGFIGTLVFLLILTLKEGTLYAVPHMFFVGILIDQIAQKNFSFSDPDFRHVFLEESNELLVFGSSDT